MTLRKLSRLSIFLSMTIIRSDNTEDITVTMVDLPTTIKGYVVESFDGWYTIVLNSRLNHEQNVESYLHELSHVSCLDFEKCNVHDIETMAHKQK